MHKTPKLAQLSTPRRAQARPVAVSWPLARPCRGQGRPCSRPQAVVSQPPLARPCAVLRAMPCRAYPVPCLQYCGPSGHVVGTGCAQARPYRRPSAARWLAVSWAVSRYGPALKLSPGHNTLRCIAIQKLSSLPSLCHNTAGVLQYTLPTAHLSCNTLPLLQYSFPAYLQYNFSTASSLLVTIHFVYCNTQHPQTSLAILQYNICIATHLNSLCNTMPSL